MSEETFLKVVDVLNRNGYQVIIERHDATAYQYCWRIGKIAFDLTSKAGKMPYSSNHHTEHTEVCPARYARVCPHGAVSAPNPYKILRDLVHEGEQPSTSAAVRLLHTPTREN